MKTILITIFISLSLSASAQFNTIAPAGSHLNKKATAKVTDTTAVVSNNSSEEEREEDLPVTDKAVDWYHPPLKGKLHITSSFGKKKSEHHNGLTSQPKPAPQYTQCCRARYHTSAMALAPATISNYATATSPSAIAIFSANPISKLVQKSFPVNQ